jgi:hypothetical protein
MFGIPVVQKSEVVVYIDLNPFEFWTKNVSWSKNLGIHYTPNWCV